MSLVGDLGLLGPEISLSEAGPWIADNPFLIEHCTLKKFIVARRRV